MGDEFNEATMQEETEVIPKIDIENPDTLAAVAKLVEREVAYFKSMRVEKRPDGSFWARLVCEATKEDIDHALTAHAEGLMHNRGELIQYLANDPEALKRLRLPFYGAAVSKFLESASPEQYFNVPAEYLLGHFSKFRIKDYQGRREVHADLTLLRRSDFELIKDSGICPSLFVMRHNVYRWWARDVKHLNFFYQEASFDVIQRTKNNFSAFMEHKLRSLLK